MVNKVNNKASGTSCHQESAILSLFTHKDKEKIVIPPPNKGEKHHRLGFLPIPVFFYKPVVCNTMTRNPRTKPRRYPG